MNCVCAHSQALISLNNPTYRPSSPDPQTISAILGLELDTVMKIVTIDSSFRWDDLGILHFQSLPYLQLLKMSIYLCEYRSQLLTGYSLARLSPGMRVLRLVPLNNASPNIRKSWQVLFEKGKTKHGRESIRKAGQVCKAADLDNEDDVLSYAQWLQAAFDFLAMVTLSWNIKSHAKSLSRARSLLTIDHRNILMFYLLQAYIDFFGLDHGFSQKKVWASGISRHRLALSIL